MASQTDLDQGGTYRTWEKVYMGPSMGLVWIPSQSRFGISAPGSYTIDPSIVFVAINNPSGGVVTITLPSLAAPPFQAVQPGVAGVTNPIVRVIDIFGNAATSTYTIQPAAGDILDNNLASVQINSNFGQFAFTASAGRRLWTTS